MNSDPKQISIEDRIAWLIHRAAADAARKAGASFAKAQAAGFAATTKLAKSS